jgi:hypothetical protein
MKKNEMGGACGMKREGWEVPTQFWWGEMREREPLEVLSIDGKIILKGSSRNRRGGVGHGQDLSGSG